MHAVKQSSISFTTPTSLSFNFLDPTSFTTPANAIKSFSCKPLIHILAFGTTYILLSHTIRYNFLSARDLLVSVAPPQQKPASQRAISPSLHDRTSDGFQSRSDLVDIDGFRVLDA